MGQGYSVALPPGPGAIEGAELSDLTFEKPLGGARFLRTIRARQQHGVVVAKLCMKANSGVSFKSYAKALRHERQTLKDVPNALAYQRIRETSTLGVLVRQFIHTSLYDRISIRPFLESIEKKWIAFQLLCAIRDCHGRGIFHGDIKSENVLVTSWGWVYLTDFASTFKPVYLPEDNPADFSYYYDTSARRTCYLAPERFLAAGQQASENKVVQWNMDIFSLGCVIAELFTEAPTFTLSQLFKYRKGEYDPTVTLLNKVDDEHVRALICSMIRLDPGERWHAQDYLDEYKAKAFPLHFYQHLHALMQDITDPNSGRKTVVIGETNNGESDDRIERIYSDFEMLSVSLGYKPAKSLRSEVILRPGEMRGLFPMQVDLPNDRHTANASLTMEGDNGTFILLNVITASMRSCARASSKLRACELLLAFAERLPDEAKLDRILPYVMPLLDDANEVVLVAALRTMTQLLALVTVASPVNLFLFTQYIFPRLQNFVTSKGFRNNAIVRATYAACLASLAETAARFLHMMQALKAEGSLPSMARGDEDDHDGQSAFYDAYDATRLEVLDQFEGQTKVFLTDSDTAVKRAFLTSVPSLCVFLGEFRASDVILSHLNTYLNDPDWLLKCAFFKTIVGVAVYIGGASLEEFILPLMLQALTDPQEFVVEQALRSLATMAELGLLQRPKTWELIDVVARFQMHPNLWIREASSHFVSAATTYFSVADIRIIAMPLIQPYLKVPVSSVSETELLDALKKPLARTVLDMALAWASKVDRGLFWKSVKDSRQLSYRAINQMPPVSSVRDLGPRSLGRIPKTDEDEQWLGRLRNAGMRGEDEIKVLAFREYVWRAAQRMKREHVADADSPYDSIFSLVRLKITPQTVIFENDLTTWEQRQQGKSDRTIAEALEEATTPLREMPPMPLRLDVAMDTVERNLDQATKVVDVQQGRLNGVKKQASGSLSSSPSSGVGLLGREAGAQRRQRGSATGLMNGNDMKTKAVAEVATDDTTAEGRLNRHVPSSRRASGGSQTRPRKAVQRAARARAGHNYMGNDPTVLKLLDAVYSDDFPVDQADFGPLLQSSTPAPLTSGTSSSPYVPWKPRSELVAVLSEHTDAITRIAVAPDHAFFLTASKDGCVKVWDSARLERNVTHRSRQTYRLAADVEVTSLCFIQDTHSFVCTGSDGTVHIVKVEMSESGNSTRYGKLRVMREWQIPTTSPSGEHAVWSEHYHGDGVSTLMLATNLNRVLAVDLRSMTVTFELHNPAQHGTITCFCIGRREIWLLVGTSQGVLDLWDLRFRLRVRTWTFVSPAPVTRLQLHPSPKSAKRNRVCISGGIAGEVTVWDIEKVICAEVYQPSCVQAGEHLDLRRYELRNIDDERSESLLNRVAGSIAADPRMTEQAVSSATGTTSMFVGVHSEPEGADKYDAFIIAGGPDGKVRFWDCNHLESCRLVSGGAADEKPAYAMVRTGTDFEIRVEKLAESVAQPGGVESARLQPAGRKSGGSVKPTRYETIRSSAQNLMVGHLDVITDVALLARPFGMVLSGDRSGQVFVHQ